jgi:excisionase family DNA binding protein
MRCFSEKELSEAMRIPRRTLQRLRYDGGGPHYMRVGRRVLYRQDAVENWAGRIEFPNITAEVYQNSKK